MQNSLYKYIWSVNPRGQILLIILALRFFPISMAPLELRRPIVNDAIKGADVDLFLTPWRQLFSVFCGRHWGWPKVVIASLAIG